MKRWALDQHEEDRNFARGIIFNWHDDITSGVFDTFVAFSPRDTTGAIDLSAVIPRLVCHVLVNQIPDEGITELLETLEQMRGFYITLEEPRPLMISERTKGSVSHVLNSPAFVFDE